ncbi:MAG: lipopolysaccharide heptosyltransferase II [Halioglobus sp.]
MTEPRDAVLVVGPAWVGDMVMSQVLYRQLAESRPGCVIDVLAPGWSAPLLARMPEVHRSIPMPLEHGDWGFGERRRIGERLRPAGYAQAIVLPNSWKSALVPWFAGIPRRTGWRGEMRYGLLNDLRRLNPAALPQMAQRFLALGLPRGAELPPAMPAPRLRVSPETAQALARARGLDSGRRLLVLCPGAGAGTAKRWPPEYFAELARACLTRGWQVLLLGAAGDRAACRRIAAASGGAGECLDLAGRTTLDEAVQLLSQAYAVVSNDSGLMHVAAALGRTVLGIYGPTSPAFTPPLSGRATLISPGVSCAPCHARECPLGHHRCMRDTRPDAVLARLDAALNDQGGA